MTASYTEVYERAFVQLEKRLDHNRLQHSISVANTAAAMAREYGINADKARLTGLLHDWDKCLNDKQLLERMVEFGIKIETQFEDTAALLHAQTGAAAVHREFPKLSDEIIQAISRHTSAAPDMSDLDMLIYVADMIEPLRAQENLPPLRKLVGKASLEALFFKSYETAMKHLINNHCFIHPDSLKVWNAYVAREKSN